MQKLISPTECCREVYKYNTDYLTEKNEWIVRSQWFPNGCSSAGFCILSAEFPYFSEEQQRALASCECTCERVQRDVCCARGCAQLSCLQSTGTRAGQHCGGPSWCRINNRNAIFPVPRSLLASGVLFYVLTALGRVVLLWAHPIAILRLFLSRRSNSEAHGSDQQCSCLLPSSGKSVLACLSCPCPNFAFV